jgi:O-antigen/teichoic acid export membrane protein
MRLQYRDILKHSGVYGLGQILSRLASVFMLPLYTRYLHPADYGSIAILDLTTGVLGIIIGGGIVAAVSRYHFEAHDDDEQNTVWWTGLAVVVVLATTATAPAFLVRSALARVTLGPTQSEGSYYYALMLPTLWLLTVTQIPDQYLRIRKWSWLTVAISFGGLLLNIGLNIYFLAAMHLGVAGVLLGNLISAGITGLVRFGIMNWACGAPRFRWSLAEHLWRFGSPMVVAGLLALIMHQADRYLLRLSRDLTDVGLYSLAYTVGQGLNSMVFIPFASIWGVVVYEIAKQADAKHVYERIFQYYAYALMLFLLGISLFVRPMLALFLPSEYQAAAPLIPIICLAFVFFSIHEHFKVPALLAKKTVSMLIPFAAGAITNVALNLLVLPKYGAAGAAWVSVATYATFSAVGLMRYRRIDRYDYPLVRCAAVLMAMIATYVGCAYVASAGIATIWSLLMPVIMWVAWAVILLRPMLKEQFLQPTPATAS